VCLSSHPAESADVDLAGPTTSQGSVATGSTLRLLSSSAAWRVAHQSQPASLFITIHPSIKSIPFALRLALQPLLPLRAGLSINQGATRCVVGAPASLSNHSRDIFTRKQVVDRTNWITDIRSTVQSFLNFLEKRHFKVSLICSKQNYF
jgi:hypothetical protein